MIKDQQALRLHRLGKLKIGKKTKEGYPTSIDYFRATGEYAEEFHKAYGEKPKRIQVIFPYDDIEMNMNEWYRLYGQSGLKCICDGEIAKKVIEGEFIEQECDCDPNNRECTASMLLTVVVLNLSVMGAWQIFSSSVNSRMNIRSALTLTKLRTNGKLAGIPFYLSVQKETSIISGKKHIYPVLMAAPIELPALKQTQKLLQEKEKPTKNPPKTTTESETTTYSQEKLAQLCLEFLKDKKISAERWNELHKEILNGEFLNTVNKERLQKFLDRLILEVMK